MKVLTPSGLNLTSSMLSHNVKSIYLTSPQQGAGTTTCAYAFAKAISEQVSKKVVLIDGNPGPASLTKKLNLVKKQEVSDSSIADIEASPQKVIHKIENESFHIIPAGMLHNEGAIEGDRTSLDRVLKSLSESYNYIIYDGPPIHKYNEALALAACFDGVIMVLKNNATRLEVAVSARDKLTQAGANVIGAIYNRRRYYVPRWLYNLLY